MAFSFMVQEPSGIMRMAERQILRLEVPDVAEHFRFGMVPVENRVGEEGRFAILDFGFWILFRNRLRCKIRILPVVEDFPERPDVLARCGFVERDGDGVALLRTEIHQVFPGGFQDFFYCAGFHPYADGVEERFRVHLVTEPFQPFASTLASACTRSAICFKPSGPW